MTCPECYSDRVKEQRFDGITSDGEPFNESYELCLKCGTRFAQSDTLEDDWLERLTTPSPRMLSEEDDGVWPNPNDDWDYVRDGRDSAEAFS